MDKNSGIIKTEIIRILNENGKIRGTELAKRVIEKVGNEKMVYREISALVEAGEINIMVSPLKNVRPRFFLTSPLCISLVLSKTMLICMSKAFSVPTNCLSFFN